jgi:hypothetical protein
MLPNGEERGRMSEARGQRFAVVLNEQGRFAQTCVGEFNLLPEVGRHVWKGTLAETAEELASQVNGALKALVEFGDPFLTIEVVAVGDEKLGSKKAEVGNGEPDTSELILEANRQLQEVIEQIGNRPGRLKVLTPA